MDIFTLSENGILEISNIISYMFRWLGWKIVQGLSYLVSGIEEVVNDIYTLNGFFYSEEMNSLIDRYKPLIWVLLSISIGILGFKIMFNKKQNRGELPSNILYSILVVTLLPTFMIKLNDITELAVQSVNINNTTLTSQMVKSNINDLYYLDKNDFDISKGKNNIDEGLILTIDENETIDADKTKNKDTFKKKVTMKDSGERVLEKLETGFLKWDEEYYRYDINFTSIIVSLGAMGIALVCVSLKVVRLLMELGANKLFATLLAFADIDDGKKLKEIIRHIISIFIVIFATAIMLKIYLLYNVWIEKTLIDTNLGRNEVLKMIFVIGGAIAVIDGPNIVERILGIDVGLKSAWGAAMASYGVAKGALNGAKMIGSATNTMGKTLAGGIAMGVAGASGATKGQFDSMKGVNKNNPSVDKANEKESEAIKKQDINSTANTNKGSSTDSKANIQNKNESSSISSEVNNKEGIEDNKKIPSTDNLEDKKEVAKTFNGDISENKAKSQEGNSTLKEKGNEADNKAKDINSELKSNGINNDKDIPGIDGKAKDINSDASTNSTNGNIENGKESSDLNRGSGKFESRTLGEYAKDRFTNSKQVDKLTRAYNIGYNTSSKWNIKGKKENKITERKNR